MLTPYWPDIRPGYGKGDDQGRGEGYSKDDGQGYDKDGSENSEKGCVTTVSRSLPAVQADFRVYPQGITHDQTSQRVKGLAVML